MTIPSWAYRGAKVVCVLAPIVRKSGYEAGCKNVVVGETYTIRATAVIGHQAGCWLEEIVNPIGDRRLGLNGESGFPIECFRPAVSQADDLATHFQALLNVSNPEQVEA